MLPQPLPSGYPLQVSSHAVSPTRPLTHLPPHPPPPLPPRISAAAFFVAAAAATVEIHPARRSPTFHIAVLLASARAPVLLLRHAHHLLLSLSAKGFHVFLQTEAALSSSAPLVPLSPALLPDAIAASRADFVAILTEHHISTQTVRVRLSSSTDFSDVPSTELPNVLLAAWVKRLRTFSATPDCALPANPNIVTASHLDAFLQKFSQLRSIPRLYARLQHSVHFARGWQYPLERSSRKYSSMDGNAHRRLLNDALRRGLRAAARLNGTPNTRTAHKCVYGSELSFSWLQRSEAISAHILRSKILARALHTNLAETLRRVVGIPPVMNDSSLVSSENLGILSNAHRHRLIRLVNELLPRVEHLAAQLNKRPRKRYRRGHFPAADPWKAYIDYDKMLADSDLVPHHELIARSCANTVVAGKKGWLCCACRSFNDGTTICVSCCTSICRIDQQLSSEELERFSMQFEKVSESGPLNCLSLPWVFVPGLPTACSVARTRLPKFPAHTGDRARRKTLTKTITVFDNESHHKADEHHGSLASLDTSKRPRQSQERDLSSRLHGISIGNDFETTANLGGATHLRKRNSVHETYQSGSPSRKPPLVTQNEPIRNHNAQTSLSSLASSAPSGTSFGAFLTGSRNVGIMRPVHGTHWSSGSFRSTDTNPRNTSLGDNSLTNHVSNAQFAESLPAPDSYLLRSPNDGDKPLYSSVPTLFDVSLTGPTPSYFRNAGPSCTNDPDATSSKADSNNFAGNERAFGSYETREQGSFYDKTSRRTTSQPIAVPGADANAVSMQNEIASIEALAAASDAANGGVGSATMESLRVVSAVVTPGRSQKPDEYSNDLYSRFR